MRLLFFILIICLISCKRNNIDYKPIIFKIDYTNTLIDYSVSRMIEGSNIAYGVVKFGDTLNELNYDHYNGEHQMKLVLFATDSLHKENMKYFTYDPDIHKKIEDGNDNDVIIIIDTTQIIPKPNYYNVSVTKPSDTSRTFYMDYYNYEKTSLKKYYRDSNQINYVKSYPIYIYNNSNIPIKYETRETWLPVILEAKKNFIWQPIEYWDCKYVGDGQHNDWIMPGYVLISSIFKYHGDFSTQVRAKVLLDNKVYYSNAVKMTINMKQFDYFGNFEKDEYKEMKLEK